MVVVILKILNFMEIAIVWMWGGGNFGYLKCKYCNCIQIKNLPKDMSVYYNSNYYSMKTSGLGVFYEFLEINSLKYNISRKKISLGKLINFVHQGENRAYLAEVKKSDAVLDVGCGKGHLLKNLALLGYKNLYGCDPFLDNDIHLDGLDIYKTTVELFNSTVSDSIKFKLIMFNHSLEHVNDPLATLKAAKGLLAEDGFIVISLPVLNDFYWEKYGKDLYLLDPPLHIFTVYDKSMQILLKRSGLIIQYKTWYYEPTAELRMKIAKERKNKEISLFDHCWCSLINRRKIMKYNKYGIGFNGTYICTKSSDN